MTLSKLLHCCQCDKDVEWYDDKKCGAFLNHHCKESTDQMLDGVEKGQKELNVLYPNGYDDVRLFIYAMLDMDEELSGFWCVADMITLLGAKDGK